MSIFHKGIKDARKALTDGKPASIGKSIKIIRGLIGELDHENFLKNVVQNIGGSVLAQHHYEINESLAQAIELLSKKNDARHAILELDKAEAILFRLLEDFKKIKQAVDKLGKMTKRQS